MSAGETHQVLREGWASDHSSDAIYDRLDQAIRTVEARVRVDPSSRVSGWVGALRSFSRSDKRSILEQIVLSLVGRSWHHPSRDAFRALIDSRMFIEIVAELSPLLSDHDLNDLVSGATHPDLDSSSSRARDREFELFVAAISRRAGLKPELTEPDIRIIVDGDSRVIAAKRLASRKRVEKNVSEASRQILRAGSPGYIFLDVTTLLDPTHSIITHWRTAGQTAGGAVLAFANTEYRRALRRRRNDHVCGLVLRCAFPHVSQHFMYGTYETWWALATDGVDPADINNLLRAFLSGLRGT